MAVYPDPSANKHADPDFPLFRACSLCRGAGVMHELDHAWTCSACRGKGFIPYTSSRRLFARHGKPARIAHDRWAEVERARDRIEREAGLFRLTAALPKEFTHFKGAA